MKQKVKLVLGTAQLGLPYGKVNASQPPPIEVAHAVLTCAVDAGFAVLDTARAYGVAEDRIGSWLSLTRRRLVIITKCQPLSSSTDATALKHELLSSFDASRSTLGIDCVAAFLVHRSADLFRPGVAEALRALKSGGRIGGFGASVYEPEEFRAVLHVEGVTDIQAPMSVFDQRLVQSQFLSMASDRGIRVWIRSVFLQGVLFIEPQRLPDFLAPVGRPLEDLRRMAGASNVSLAALAMQAAASQDGVSGLVLGAHTPDQVTDLARAFEEDIPEDLLHQAIQFCGGLPESVIDPRRWPGTHGTTS